MSRVTLRRVLLQRPILEEKLRSSITEAPTLSLRVEDESSLVLSERSRVFEDSLSVVESKFGGFIQMLIA